MKNENGAENVLNKDQTVHNSDLKQSAHLSHTFRSWKIISKHLFVSNKVKIIKKKL